jgi:hypothetical protein
MKSPIVPLALLVLMTTLCHSQGQIGRTLDECVQHYDSARVLTPGVPNLYTLSLDSGSSPEVKYSIFATFTGGKVSKICYMVIDYRHQKMYLEDAESLLKTTAPAGLVWGDYSKDAANDNLYWTGTINGKVAYYAHKTWQLSLEIWDAATDVGGVTGATQVVGEDGSTYTILPPQQRN